MIPNKGYNSAIESWEMWKINSYVGTAENENQNLGERGVETVFYLGSEAY